MNEIKARISKEEERQFLSFVRDAVENIGYRVIDFTSFQPNTYLIIKRDWVYGKVEFIHLADNNVEVRIVVTNNSLYNNLSKVLKGANAPLKNS
jgi:hypothetical protein